MADRSRRVIWTEFAKTGLDDTLAYFGEDSPDAAGRFLEVVLDTAQSLSFFSERGRFAPEFQRQDTREVFVHRYRILYQVTPSEVHIVAFVHGARDFRDWVI